MEYEFPDEEMLLRYLAVLREILIDAKLLAYERAPQVAELLDAVENVPDLLTRWGGMNLSIVQGELENYEREHLVGAPGYSSVFHHGLRLNWQLRWGK
ncbi:hypothetical protein [Sorangium sp. So ce128]|uniref:hypothetical protein n=1 Tax=Sorangium sp. So ce128 TaxID=3133281 RepID=UPI003F60AAEC